MEGNVSLLLSSNVIDTNNTLLASSNVTVSPTIPYYPIVPFLFEAEGCPQYELFIIQFIMILSIWLRNLLVHRFFSTCQFRQTGPRYWFKFTIDFVVVILTMLLAMTILSSYLIIFSGILASIVAVLLIWLVYDYRKSADRLCWQRVLSHSLEENFENNTFVTYMRSSMLIQIAIAILAVDFVIFPDRYGKTGHYGHSVMDIGVAACIYAFGLGRGIRSSAKNTKPRKRTWWTFLMSSQVLLPFIGFARLFFIWLFNYGHSISEYGVHWNFFFTLAVVVIVSNILPVSYPVITFFFFAIAQEAVLLGANVEAFVLEGNNRRDNFFTMNAEGISSLMGYISIYYATFALAKFISRTSSDIRSWFRCCVWLFVIALLFFGAQLVTELFCNKPSRRIANIPYALSQLSLLTFGLGWVLLIHVTNIAISVSRVHKDTDELSCLQPCLLETINNYGLWYFLLANILTGVVNMTFNTNGMEPYEAFLIMCLYMFISSFVFHLWRRCKSLKTREKPYLLVIGESEKPLMEEI